MKNVRYRRHKMQHNKFTKKSSIAANHTTKAMAQNLHLASCKSTLNDLPADTKILSRSDIFYITTQ